MNFHVVTADFDLIESIADRAVKEADKIGARYPRIDILMDLTACHANGTPLDLARLLEFPDFDFAHDVWGIRHHINRNTGGLGDCFVPRCARVAE